MVQDRELSVSVCRMVTWLLWATAAGILVASYFMRDMYFGNFGILIAAAAATATVRGYFVSQSKTLRALRRSLNEDALPDAASLRPLR